MYLSSSKTRRDDIFLLSYRSCQSSSSYFFSARASLLAFSLSAFSPSSNLSVEDGGCSFGQDFLVQGTLPRRPWPFLHEMTIWNSPCRVLWAELEVESHQKVDHRPRRLEWEFLVPLRTGSWRWHNLDMASGHTQCKDHSTLYRNHTTPHSSRMTPLHIQCKVLPSGNAVNRISRAGCNIYFLARRVCWFLIWPKCISPNCRDPKGTVHFHLE